MSLDLLLILGLILLNGFFAMSEMAVVTSRKSRLRQMSANHRGARMALQLAEHPENFLSAVQIGITLVGILTGAIGGVAVADDVAVWVAAVPLLADHAHGVAIALSVGAITFATLILGELVPKRLALLNPERITSLVAPPLAVLAVATRRERRSAHAGAAAVMLGPAMNPRASAPRTTELIRETLESIQGDEVVIGELVDRFGQRGFGVLLLFLSLPAFIPVPGVAGVTGPVIALLGLQMLLGLRRPWLPGFVRRKTMSKQTFARFTTRMGRLLKVLERFCQPRVAWLFDQAGLRASGLVLILYGLLLALPIPFTNYIFGLVLLSIAIAMIERDGLLLVGSWFVVGPLVLAFGVLLRNLKAWRLRRRRRNGNHRSE